MEDLLSKVGSSYNPNYGGSALVNDPNAFLFSLEYKEKYPSYNGILMLYMIVTLMVQYPEIFKI